MYTQNPPSPYVPCPRCGNPYPQPVGYTLWGGFIGPKLLKHVKCHQCGYTFNGKTGQSNDKAILLYLTVPVVVLVLLLMACLICSAMSSASTSFIPLLF